MKAVNNKPRRSQEKVEELIDIKKQTVEQLFNRAEQQYQRLASQQQSKWNSIIAKAGTKKDKITLMGTQIIKNPHISLSRIQQLTAWCFDKNHHFALDACRAMVNIYNEYVFSQKNHLKVFSDSVQEEISKKKKKSVLTLADLMGFYLQHHIKHYYTELIRSIQVLLESTITFIKKTAIQMLISLTKHSELRRQIIRTLINKFGDPDLNIVNAICKQLKQQFAHDIQSSAILLQQAQSFLLRAHLSSKAQFYMINFLNNLNMKMLNEKGLSKLFQLFYHFFQKMIGNQTTTESKKQSKKEKEASKNQVSSRLFLNSIKGLNKIFNFIKSSNQHTRTLVQQKTESVYRIIHTTTNTKAKIQLYLFLFQCHSHLHGNLPDRYYRSLYDFIGHDQVLHCSLGELFFDLLLVSMKQDSNLNRLMAFLKRILQLCFTAQANFIVTTLILIGNVFAQNEALKIMLKQAQNNMAQGNQRNDYDMFKRQPIYAGAENTLLWQLTLLTNHYHPTVRKYATHVIKGEPIPYDGSNPLIQLSTTSFLQKMVLKKEKKSDAWRLKVKKHIQKMRTSKYESLLDKASQNFKQNEEFIKKYLEQRSQIHKNFKKRQPQDIQEFADQVIEKQMQRLNPHDEDLDLSFSEQPEQQNSDQEQVFEDQEFEEEEPFEEDEQGQQQAQQMSQEFQDDYDDDQDEQDQESQEKEFEDVFNDIGQDGDEYMEKPKRKGKQFKKTRAIRKPNKKQQFKGRKGRR